MYRYIEVIQNLLPLLSTLEEGLVHIKKQLSELRYEEALGLLEDCLLAIASIEAALQPMAELSLEKVFSLTATLKAACEKVVATCEKENPEQAEIIISTQLLPVFQEWKSELEKILTPYISS
ncbi:hypothetical protein SAMN02745221_02068 [Thermosyntropha lipolytica DSM 11003]|uniref:DUF8042 domain-containing protein n=1 Tax=Thermosyntropha lipolytica DSM 11003 TaxID=1123382 RepID=A0A1M5RMU4_9FIRM|nr:hypothetical protein [Thermosyntropha lipolytica]SHH27481.1 hypothetical protein SAMN02745221_02068 [Thermosyntropha lipolytica DSM 11003]